MQKITKQYILFTYLAFFLFILCIGFVMLKIKNNKIVEMMKIMSSWTPNLIFLVMFKKIYPHDSRTSFIIRQFASRLKLKALLAAFALPFFVFLGSMIALSIWSQKPLWELLDLSPSFLLLAIPSHLIRGPLGEELGWRGFLFQEYRKKHSIIKTGMLVGLIWGFWHFPLWLVSGLSAIDLVIYILSFLVSIVCCSIMIGLVYSYAKNIVIPVMMHMLNNYFLGLFTCDIIPVLICFAVFYSLVTIVLVCLHKKKQCAHLLTNPVRN